jgi:hypothetical protein
MRLAGGESRTWRRRARKGAGAGDDRPHAEDSRCSALNIPVKQLVGGDVTVTYNFEGIDLEGLR